MDKLQKGLVTSAISWLVSILEPVTVKHKGYTVTVTAGVQSVLAVKSNTSKTKSSVIE
jgi:hypothetical protein